MGERVQCVRQSIAAGKFRGVAAGRRFLWIVAQRRGSSWRDLARNEAKTLYGGPTEIGIYSGAQRAAFVLQKHRSGRICSQREDGSGGTFADPQRLSDVGNVGSGNFPPSQDQSRITESRAIEGRAAEFGRIGCNRGDAGSPLRRVRCCRVRQLFPSACHAVFRLIRYAR